MLGESRNWRTSLSEEAECVCVSLEDRKVWKGGLSRGKGLHKALGRCTSTGEEFHGVQAGDEADRVVWASGLFRRV